MFSRYNKMNAKQKMAVITSLTVVFIAAFIYLLILPTTGEIENLRSEIIKQKIDFENANEKSKSLNRLEQQINIIKPQAERFEQVFINKNRELEFITTLENMANANRVEQKINLNTAKIGESDALTAIALNLNAVGTLDNLLNYLVALETSSYYINIKSLALTSSAQNRSRSPIPDDGSQAVQPKTNVTMTISADTFWK